MKKLLRPIVLIAGLMLNSPSVYSEGAPRQCHGFFNLTERIPANELRQAKKRLEKAEIHYYRISPGQIITLQIVAPASPGKPTLLLLPGIFRAMTALSIEQEPRALELAKLGFGMALVSLSTHPYSIMQLAAGETPANKDRLSDYVQEVNTAVTLLKNEHQIDQVIPVSLSFSSAVSVGLKGFPTIIETVPLTSTAVDKPELATALRNLNGIAAMNTFNPFFDRNFVRNSLDKSYQENWKKYVDSDPTGHLANHQPNSTQTASIISGYVAMTRAIETFTWPEANKLPANTRRIFILAKNEMPELLQDQIKNFKNVLSQEKKTVLIMIEESGHVIPKDQPAAYAMSIGMALSTELKNFSGVVVITPSTGVIKKIVGAGVEKYLNSLSE